MEKDAFYFPHFCNARQDRKIKRVRKELGLEGYGIYFMLLETLREQQEFKFPMEDIDLLADEFGTSEQKLRTVICNYELFQVDEEQNFFSVSFIKYLTPYLEGKQRKRISGIKGNLVKYGYATKESLENLSDLEILELNENKQLLPKLSHCESLPIRTASQSKEKESKVNEKESKINNNETYFTSDDKTLNLTVLQKENLITKYTNIDIDYYIEKIITYNEGKPKSKKYKNLNLTLQDWIKNDIERNGKYYEVYKKPTVNNANIEMWED